MTGHGIAMCGNARRGKAGQGFYKARSGTKLGLVRCGGVWRDSARLLFGSEIDVA